MTDLFGNKENDWHNEWVDMPEFIMGDLSSKRKLIIHFRSEDDVDIFAKLLNQKITPKQKSLWYPEWIPRRYANKRWVSKSLNTNNPIFIISKGRHDRQLTGKALNKMNMSYKVVVEEHEYKKYQQVYEKDYLLVLENKYLKEYETCDDLGDTKSKGPGAARNYCWDYAISEGYKYHWVMDDNIAGFGRINNNLYVPVTTGAIFRCTEDFVDRYKNIAIAGFNYDFFAKAKTQLPPYVLNTRIYSCLFIRNDIPYRWRGRYNEDTDLSIRVLKDGWCTIQFNAFIQEKATTQTIKGGNTKEFYEVEGTLPKSEMIAKLHPDIASIVWRFNRHHHYVDYRQFKKNKLIRKADYEPKKQINNYGMELVINENNRKKNK